MKLIAQLPKTQKLVETITLESGTFQIARITNTNEYVLYAEKDGGLEKLEKGKNPLMLEKLVEHM